MRLKLVVLVAVAVVGILVAVIADEKNKINASGHTEADRLVAVEIADHLESGYSDHVTRVKVVGKYIYIDTDLDGSIPLAVAHARAVDICNAAKAVAPDSKIYVDSVYGHPIFGC